MNPNWHNVSKREPCPICHKTDWCSISNNGEVCVCHRVESPYPTKSGYGWIHRLKERVVGASVVSSWRTRTTNKPTTAHQLPTTTHQLPTTNYQLPATNYQLPASPYFSSLPTGDLQTRLCARLERELGLPRTLLEMHDVRWDSRANAAAFPMRNAAGDVTGIRYRQLNTGRKWALKGSKDGLFYIPEYIPITDEIVVCEGPTDMLAAASVGLNAVGRSSCMTGAALLREFIRAHRVKRVSIIGDNDKPHDRPDGSWWRPGLDGAAKLARDLRVSARIVLPPPHIKDTREWYRSGLLTKATFLEAASGAKWLI